MDSAFRDGMKILCVDDDALVLAALKRLFRYETVEVLTASSGADGLSILSATPDVTLIISDHMMPNMNGVDFLTQARLIAPQTPGIILTGYAPSQLIADALRDGVVKTVFNKPWRNPELLQNIKDFLADAA